MALIMLETKVEVDAKGEKKTYPKGGPAPAKWAGKPFVGDDKKKPVE